MAHGLWPSNQTRYNPEYFTKNNVAIITVLIAGAYVTYQRRDLYI